MRCLMKFLSMILLFLIFMNPASFQASEETTTSKTSLSVARKIVFQTKHSGVVQESHRIVDTKEVLKDALQGEISSEGENGLIDFSKTSVFIAYLGQRSNGCYGIEFGEVEFVYDEETKKGEDGEDNSQEAEGTLSLFIEIIEKIPAEDCLCPQVIVTPAIGILIPKIDERSIRIKKAKSVLQCN